MTSSVLVLSLSACGGGSDPADNAETVAIDGTEIGVTWDQATAETATAVGVITSEEPILVAAQAIERVTGCTALAGNATLGDGVFIRSDGRLELTLGIDCSKTPSANTISIGQNTTTASAADDSAQMAAAIEQAIRQVVSDPAPATVPASTAPRSLYEGSPYSAFTAAEIQSYCGQGWETRIAANGRTEYNPCTQRSAFR